MRRSFAFADPQMNKPKQRPRVCNFFINVAVIVALHFETAKLDGTDPLAWLAAMPARLPDLIDELLPWD
ncbi:MAG: transposase domain-containing protein [Proteobacteria bacterium]|nr:transposase domain-containing protein [Pseudomonadota bacterium]